MLSVPAAHSRSCSFPSIRSELPITKQNKNEACSQYEYARWLLGDFVRDTDKEEKYVSTVTLLLLYAKVTRILYTKVTRVLYTKVTRVIYTKVKRVLYTKVRRRDE